MKKTIAFAALAASSSAMAIIGPIEPKPDAQKTICLQTYQDDNGVMYSGKCDESFNNEFRGREILENGCAEGQTAINAVKWGEAWDVNIVPCLRPNIVQL